MHPLDHRHRHTGKVCCIIDTPVSQSQHFHRHEQARPRDANAGRGCSARIRTACPPIPVLCLYGTHRALRTCTPEPVDDGESPGGANNRGKTCSLPPTAPDANRHPVASRMLHAGFADLKRTGCSGYNDGWYILWPCRLGAVSHLRADAVYRSSKTAGK
jgi:hypothetical protein